MYSHIKNEIIDIQEQMKTCQNRYARRGGAMSADEKKNLRDMQDRIEELKMSLPANSPLTMGFNSGASSSDGPFNSFGEQLRAVVQAGIPGGQVDPRLYAAASGLNETTPSDGGFLVQSDFSTMLLEGLGQTAILAPRCNRISLSGNANSIKLPGIDESSRANGSRWGGITSYWVDEAGELTASKPKFRQLELSLKKIIGTCYATDELVADAALLGTVVMQGFNDELGFAVDDAIFRGSGAGQPLGFINSGCLVTVPAEGGQGASTVIYENVMKMFARMPARNRRNAAWFVNQDIEPQLYSMSLAVGTGGSAVFLPGGSASNEPYASLFGRPVIPIEQASTLGTVGDIVLADMSQYLLCDKGGVKTDVSIHVRFMFDEQIFRFVYRVDGQPSWAAPLTPYKGAGTLSPFVALAAR